ncbi:MAG: hypothetical protein B6U86_06300 [Candidatus Altiarchaeales archaeon ex4484_43]|nr:MAG: hypothetical protein B6U86_06300 [Candidatus Altiarchaeales archaeon ex4484_43]
MRIKETTDDYRYIPDPDIPPLVFEKSFIEGIGLPETPQNRKKRLIERYKIPEKYAQILVREKELADLFEDVAPNTDPKIAADWICREVLRQLNYRGIDLKESKLNSKILIEVLKLIKDKKITETTGKKILERIIDSGESPIDIVEKETLGRISKEDELSMIVDDVISENPEAVQDYESGKKRALNFLMGQVMRKMNGRADAEVVIRLLMEKLG